MTQHSTTDRVIQAVAITVLVFAAFFTWFALTNPAPWSPLGQLEQQRHSTTPVPVTTTTTDNA